MGVLIKQWTQAALWLTIVCRNEQIFSVLDNLLSKKNIALETLSIIIKYEEGYPRPNNLAGKGI